MAHNEGPRPLTFQQILNAVAVVSGTTPYLNVGLAADSITLSAEVVVPSYISAFVDNGSVSARSGDANQVHVSAVQGDAGLFRTSAFDSVVTTNTGGTSIYWTSSGATSQVSTVKSAAGRLYGYDIGNAAGVDQYLQIFNASGGATAGTDTPALTIYVPTLKQSQLSLTTGVGFSNGIQIIGTSTVNGQTIGASALRVNLYYA